jgi:hypothetical protein
MLVFLLVARMAFSVKAIEPLRTLVLGGETDKFQWTWQFGLYPVDEWVTRLISRNRARLPRTIGSTLFMCILNRPLSS